MKHRPNFLGQPRDGGAAQMMSQAMGIPLQLLTRFADSELANKLGLVEPAQKLIYRGTRDGLRSATRAASRFKGKATSRDPDRMARPDQPKLFDLTFTDEQQLTRDTMHRFASEVMRGLAEEADEKSTPPARFLAQSHELGMTMMAVPESHGGIGEERSPVANTLIAEDLAWGDMGMAMAALSPLSVVNAIVDWGSAAQQAKYLPAFAEDDFIPAAMALLEPDPLFDFARVRTGAVRNDEDGYDLHGEKSMVALGESAEIFLVAANILGVGPRLFIVERGAPGLTVEPEPTMGLRSAGLCRLHFAGVKVSADAMLGEPGRKGFDYPDLIDRAHIAWSALAVGTCQAVLDYVITYCNDRKAFGEPITNRQAVAFMIADIAIELEGMRLLTYHAASRAEQGLPYRREAYLAHLQCADKAMKIGSDGVQLLGGHGYVKDHPVERWYRNLRAIAVVEGGLLV